MFENFDVYNDRVGQLYKEMEEKMAATNKDAIQQQGIIYRTYEYLLDDLRAEYKKSTYEPVTTKPSIKK